MGAFEHFPYTNYQDFNLDWVLRAVKEVQKKIDEFDADIEQMVDQWLADHPEATTTVQDNSLTLPKFTADLKLVTVKDYLTPQMYGAVGDGVTDDSTALQDALNAAQAQKKPLALISNYYCDSNLTVPSYVRVFGLSQNTERTPYVFAGPNVTVLFDMPGIINRFDNFGVANSGFAYRSNIFFQFRGNSSNDIDSTMYGILMSYCHTCVVCMGRNLELYNCHMGHCAYGIYYDLPNQQMRGLTLKGCAFHGVGEESALNWFENSACIFIESDYNTNMLIADCHSEQSGTFFKGRVTQGLFIGNFIESYKADIIEITEAPSGTLSNTGSMLFVGNSFNGKAGPVAVGVTVDLPKHAVTITRNGRISFVGNMFRRFGEEAVVMSSGFRCTFSDNVFVNPGATDGTKCFAFKFNNASSAHCIIQNNMAADSGIGLYSSNATGSAYVKQNAGFDMPATSSGVTYECVRTLYPIGVGHGGAAIDFSLPERFYVSRDGTDRGYYFETNGTQYTTGFASISANSWETVYLENSGGNIIPYVKVYTLTSGSVSVSNYASQLTFYQIVD